MLWTFPPRRDHLLWRIGAELAYQAIGQFGAIECDLIMYAGAEIAAVAFTAEFHEEDLAAGKLE